MNPPPKKSLGNDGQQQGSSPEHQVGRGAVFIVSLIAYSRPLEKPPSSSSFRRHDCCCVVAHRFFFSLSILRPSSFPTWKNRTLGWVIFLLLSCSRTTGAKPRQRHQSANFANVSPDGISFCTPRLNRTKGFHGDNINWRKNMSNDVCISPKLQSCAK